MRTYRFLLIAIAALCVALMVHAAGSLHVATGTWANGPAMSAERTSAATVLMPDGRLLITGGRDSNGNALTSAEFVNPDGSISQAPAMSIARSGHSAVWLPTGYVLVAGGTTSGGGVTNTAELFDPLANNWVTLPSTLVEARTDFTATVLRFGNVVIAGGTHAGVPVSTVEVFDVSQETFSSVGALSVARANAACAAISDWKVIVAGGSDANGSTLASTEIIDTEAGTITAGPALSAARKSASATVLLDGRVLIAGGSYPEGADANGGVAELATTEIFDTAAGTVSAGPTMSSPRAEHQAYLLPNNNGVLLVGGVSASLDLASADLFSPVSGTFISQPSMSAARKQGTGAAMYGTAFRYGTDGVLLVTGGSNQNSSEFYGFATVKTDRDDYAPGTPVIITGSGWVPGETVKLSLVESPNLDTHTLTPVVADANGNIYSDEFAPDVSDLRVKFYLTADGSKSVAQNTFLDAVSVNLVPASGPIGTIVTITTGGGGFNGNASVAISWDSPSTLLTTCSANGGGNIQAGCTFTVPSATTGGHSVSLKDGTHSFSGNFTVTGKTTPTISTWPSATSITYGDSLASSTLSGGVASVPGSFAFTSPTTKPSAGLFAAGVTFTPADTSSYNTVTGTVNVVVNKAVLTITADDKSIAFGDPVPALTYTLTGFKNSETSAVLTGAPALSTAATSSSPVGNYPITVAVGTLVSTNYSFTPVNGTLAIGKADVTVAWSNTTAAYDGSSHAITATPTPSAAVLTITYTGTDNGGASYNSTTPPTNAGSYTATATLNDTTNYKFAAAATTTSPFTISKVDPTVTATGGNFTYDTTAKAGSGSATGVGNETLTPVTLSYQDSSHNAIASAPVNAGSYYVIAHFAGNGNYNAKDSSPAAITIAKATPVVHVADVNATYDGNSHPATGTVTGVNDVALGSATITYTPGGATEPVNAGTYAALASYAGSENYDSASANATVKIDKADSTTVVTFEAGPYTYRASAFTATATATGAGNLSQSLTLSYSGDCLNVSVSDGCTAKASFAGDDNHKPSSDSKSITILKADAVVHVSGYTGTYDAIAHGATGTATGVGGVDLSAGFNFGSSFIDVPGGTAQWSFNGGTNYNNQSGQVQITINKANAHIVVNGYTGVYDAAAHSASGSATGVGGVDLSSGLNLGATFTNVPGGTAHWTFTGGTNYNDASGDAAIVISKANASITVNGYTGVYDAAAHGASGSATGVGGVDLSSGLNLGETFTNVPGGTAHWTFTGGTNYNDASGDAAIVISKANASITVNGYTGVYDAAAHGASGSATGVGGVDLSSGLNLGETFTNVPGGTAHWTFTGGTNYNDDSGDAAIVIGKAEANIHVTGYSGNYDGSAHGASGAATGVGGADLSGELNLGATFTNVPGGTAHWTFAGGTNYNDRSGDVAIDITKADPQITVTGYTGVYDGNAHGATGSATGAKNEPLAGLDLGAAFTNVPGGTAHWTFTDSTGNYNNKNGSVAIDISKADATISVTGFAGVYDGNAHGASGTAKGVKGESLSGLVITGSFTDVPGGTANWTFTDPTGNYSNASGTAPIVINRADATINVSGYTGTYDGNSHGATGTAKGAKNEALAGLVITGTFTNVPGGTANWVFTDVTGNYNNNSGTAAIVINKANATVTVTGYNVVFDNTAHTATGSAKGVLGETLTGLNLSGTTHTIVGNYTDPWSFTDSTGNYNGASGTVNDSIGAWTLSGFYQPVTTYTGGVVVWNTVKGGSTVPVKFNIYAGTTQKTDVSAVTGQSIAVYQVTCSTAGIDDSVDYVTNTGSTLLRFDATGGQFIQNWQTPKGANQCYLVRMVALDGSKLDAYFKTK